MGWQRVWGVYANLPTGEDITEELQARAVAEIQTIIKTKASGATKLAQIKNVTDRMSYAITQAIREMQFPLQTRASYLNPVVRTITKNRADRLALALQIEPALSWNMYPEGTTFRVQREFVSENAIPVDDVDAWIMARRQGIETNA